MMIVRFKYSCRLANVILDYFSAGLCKLSVFFGFMDRNGFCLID